MKSIRIGNAAGFWGDNLDAPRLVAESGRLDYLTLEYLAELTMSILAHLRSRDAQAGYATDFPDALAGCTEALRTQPELKIVTNAGGMNPAACARKAAAVLKDAGLEHVRVAAVSGDDLLPRLDEWIAQGEGFANFETDEPLGDLRSRLVSANAYLGADGIVAALRDGARVIVTGRVADASLTIGPALFEFGWRTDDWNRRAAAAVAGHLIECGAQASGGMFSLWRPNLYLSTVGYPIAELTDDGGCVITKPEGTGGAVTVATVSEQLVYEIGDPAHYLTPDVDADFSNVTLTQEGTDRVRMANARGNPAPPRYKVSMAYTDGWMASGMLTVCGRDAVAKARAAGHMILDRVRRAGFELARTNIECLGGGDSLPGVRLPGFADAGQPPWEVVLRVSAHDPRREAIERFTREFAPLVTSGPPGVTGYTGGRAKPHRVLAYWPTTIAREAVRSEVEVRAAEEWLR